jgi:hypothetical protein
MSDFSWIRDATMGSISVDGTRELSEALGDDERFRYWTHCSGLGLDSFEQLLGVPPELRNGNLAIERYHFMDENCNYVPSREGANVCGFAGLTISPISLLWEPGVSLEENTTVVPFSLSAEYPTAHSLWKASEKAPLLVYDPMKTGQVTSARQLFGNYTFGGVRSEAGLDQSGPLTGAWENGYQALALLDSNQDGAIRGVELKDLALWFDKNRDAKVDEGEMRTLLSEGVAALYYRDHAAMPDSKDLSLAIGYEREVQGKVIQGASVDWFAETFAGKDEAVKALEAIFRQRLFLSSRANGAASAVTAELPADWMNRPTEFQPHATKLHHQDLSGIWVWVPNEKGGERSPGLLALEQSADMQLRGFSAVEADLSPNPKRLRSVVNTIPATGQIIPTSNGRLSFAMEVRDPDSGSIAKSTVEVSQDGLFMLGKTTQTFSIEGNQGRSATVSYGWSAMKLSR